MQIIQDGDSVFFYDICWNRIRFMKKLQNYINGKFHPPVSGAYIENIDPSRGVPFSLIPDSSVDDVTQATEAANVPIVAVEWKPLWKCDMLKASPRRSCTSTPTM